MGGYQKESILFHSQLCCVSCQERLLYHTQVIYIYTYTDPGPSPGQPESLCASELAMQVLFPREPNGIHTPIMNLSVGTPYKGNLCPKSTLELRPVPRVVYKYSYGSYNTGRAGLLVRPYIYTIVGT